jgi:hypothetical protein
LRKKVTLPEPGVSNTRKPVLTRSNTTPARKADFLRKKIYNIPGGDKLPSENAALSGPSRKAPGNPKGPRISTSRSLNTRVGTVKAIATDSNADVVSEDLSSPRASEGDASGTAYEPSEAGSDGTSLSVSEVATYPGPDGMSEFSDIDDFRSVVSEPYSRFSPQRRSSSASQAGDGEFSEDIFAREFLDGTDFLGGDADEAMFLNSCAADPVESGKADDGENGDRHHHLLEAQLVDHDRDTGKGEAEKRSDSPADAMAEGEGQIAGSSPAENVVDSELSRPDSADDTVPAGERLIADSHPVDESIVDSETARSVSADDAVLEGEGHISESHPADESIVDSESARSVSATDAMPEGEGLIADFHRAEESVVDPEPTLLSDRGSDVQIEQEERSQLGETNVDIVQDFGDDEDQLPDENGGAESGLALTRPHEPTDEEHSIDGEISGLENEDRTCEETSVAPPAFETVEGTNEEPDARSSDLGKPMILSDEIIASDEDGQNRADDHIFLPAQDTSELVRSSYISGERGADVEHQQEVRSVDEDATGDVQAGPVLVSQERKEAEFEGPKVEESEEHVDSNFGESSSPPEDPTTFEGENIHEHDRGAEFVKDNGAQADASDTIEVPSEESASSEALPVKGEDADPTEETIPDPSELRVYNADETLQTPSAAVADVVPDAEIQKNVAGIETIEQNRQFGDELEDREPAPKPHPQKDEAIFFAGEERETETTLAGTVATDGVVPDSADGAATSDTVEAKSGDGSSAKCAVDPPLHGSEGLETSSEGLQNHQSSSKEAMEDEECIQKISEGEGSQATSNGHVPAVKNSEAILSSGSNKGQDKDKVLSTNGHGADPSSAPAATKTQKTATRASRAPVSVPQNRQMGNYFGLGLKVVIVIGTLSLGIFKLRALKSKSEHETS